MEEEPSWWRGLVAGAIVLPLLVAGAALAVQRSNSSDGTDTTVGSPAPSSTVAETPAPSTSESAAVDPPPRVRAKRLVDFATGSDLPTGGALYDVGRSAAPMAVSDGVLTHGNPLAPDATGYLETRLGSAVTKIGFVVSFPDNAATGDGGAALTAWRTSVGAARKGASGTLPDTGMRLVVAPGSWQLVIEQDGSESVLGEGTYDQPTGAARTAQRFVLVRSGAQVWVLDPSNAVTRFEDPRVQELAGPWASWELFEKTKTDTPAGIRKIWAG